MNGSIKEFAFESKAQGVLSNSKLVQQLLFNSKNLFHGYMGKLY